MSGPSLTRRGFLRLAGVVTAVPVLSTASFAGLSVPHSDRVLVDVELVGGNDALNTIVPFQDPVYYAMRPRLACGHSQLNVLDGRYAWNRALDALTDAWRAREMWIGVGVQAGPAGLSHDAALRVWRTGHPANYATASGWLESAVQAHAAGIGRSGQRVDHWNGIRFLGHRTAGRDPIQGHIASRTWSVDRVLQGAAELIEADGSVNAVRVPVDGFDTHADQQRIHEARLRKLAHALGRLRARLESSGHWQRTLVLVRSEFGRSVGENDAGGTDHGHASVTFLLGGRVRGGLAGAYTPLGHEPRSAVGGTLDFRRVLATVLDSWWGLPRRWFAGSDTLDCLRV